MGSFGDEMAHTALMVDGGFGGGGKGKLDIDEEKFESGVQFVGHLHVWKVKHVGKQAHALTKPARDPFWKKRVQTKRNA